ncbi:MAG: hypothetical protein FWG53_03615 [Clostridiales bacterium]|nr:hypothetical protein [Clostridiales bacterium]
MMEDINDIINDRIKKLEIKGVKVIDPRQTYVAQEVDIERIFPGSTLFPGTRLEGARTLVGSFAKIGTEGPATIQDTIVGAHAEVASGYLAETTLLPRAKAGANAHFRAGTLLEEDAVTAHAVGLKQSILMNSVTLGSLINFCDALISGGSSRKDHTEVGSGFIHFNFTPWGKSGDKATPSLVGNVTEGVFLDQDRIFLGGLSGIVGPFSVGFGAMLPAGQIARRSSVDSTGSISAESRRYDGVGLVPSKPVFSKKRLDSIREMNAEFIVQAYALREWYLKVRLDRSRRQGDEELQLVLAGAIETIEACISERLKRYNNFANEFELASPMDEMLINNAPKGMELDLDWKPELDYSDWVRGLAQWEKQELRSWLCSVAGELRRVL